MGYCYVAQADFELLGSSDPSTLVSQYSGITGVNHRAWPRLYLFLGQFSFHSKIEQKVQKFPSYSPQPTYITSPTINIPHHSGAFVIINKPTLTHQHPKSVVINYFILFF